VPLNSAFSIFPRPPGADLAEPRKRRNWWSARCAAMPSKPARFRDAPMPHRGAALHVTKPAAAAGSCRKKCRRGMPRPNPSRSRSSPRSTRSGTGSAPSPGISRGWRSRAVHLTDVSVQISWQSAFCPGSGARQRPCLTSGGRAEGPRPPRSRAGLPPLGERA